MPDKMTDEQFARTFAQLFQVVQRGALRPATPADILELIGPRRYVLKGMDARYLARDGFTAKQRAAIVIDDRALARELRDEGLRDHGVKTRVVRLRRRGTSGIEAIGFRPDVDARVKDGGVALGLPREDLMDLMAALTRAKRGGAE